jgi:molecular chaperone Hsp33
MIKNLSIEDTRSVLHRFILDDGKLRGAYVDGSNIIKAMKEAHQLGFLESYVLGQAYLTAALLTSQLKGKDRIQLQVDCEGPIRGWSVESNAYGQIRGYLKTDHIPLSKPLENFDLSEFYGQGVLTLTKTAEGAKHPYVGSSILYHSQLALDMAEFYVRSEQIPTAFNLSIKFDHQGDIEAAGALFIQAMPGADENHVNMINDQFKELPSLANYLAEDKSLNEVVFTSFKDYEIKFLETQLVEFYCPCNKDYFDERLISLSKKELQDIEEEGPHPMVVVCNHCNAKYEFQKDEITNMINRVK